MTTGKVSRTASGTRKLRLTARGHAVKGVLRRIAWFVLLILAVDLVQGLLSHLFGVSNVSG